ncbi:expressed protein [Arabidopsis lyrata subsp. lyrata]|uniref:Expressed protein n=1 Tax=Arabidopsis lyrata subsp. lyrata TaxID=81972 RepID=D7M6B0_ARALL|nr:expressed protein [Arabidopsis lyrata subsp. lyrata]
MLRTVESECSEPLNRRETQAKAERREVAADDSEFLRKEKQRSSGDEPEKDSQLEAQPNGLRRHCLKMDGE